MVNVKVKPELIWVIDGRSEHPARECIVDDDDSAPGKNMVKVQWDSGHVSWVPAKDIKRETGGRSSRRRSSLGSAPKSASKTPVKKSRTPAKAKKPSKEESKAGPTTTSPSKSKGGGTVMIKRTPVTQETPSSATKKATTTKVLPTKKTQHVKAKLKSPTMVAKAVAKERETYKYLEAKVAATKKTANKGTTAAPAATATTTTTSSSNGSATATTPHSTPSSSAAPVPAVPPPSDPFVEAARQGEIVGSIFHAFSQPLAQAKAAVVQGMMEIVKPFLPPQDNNENGEKNGTAK